MLKHFDFMPLILILQMHCKLSISLSLIFFRLFLHRHKLILMKKKKEIISFHKAKATHNINYQKQATSNKEKKYM